MALLFLTCEVEDLGPLLADVDTDVRPSYSQVGTTLIEHKGLDLEQKNTEMIIPYSLLWICVNFVFVKLQLTFCLVRLLLWVPSTTSH